MKILPPDFNPMNVEKTANDFIQTANVMNFSFHAGEVFYLDYEYDENLKNVKPTNDLSSLEIPEIQIKVNRKIVETIRKEVRTELSTEQLKDLDSLRLHNVSGYEYLLKSTDNQYVSEIEKEILDMYDKLSAESQEKRLSKYQKLVRKWFNVEFYEYAETPMDVSKKIFLYSMYVATASRRGAANFAIVDMQTSAFLQDDPRFVYESNIPQGYSVSSLYPIGNIVGIRIFVNPYIKYNDGKVILGRYTKNQEPGVIFGEYQKHFECFEEPQHNRHVFSLVSGVCIQPIGNHAADNYIQFNIMHMKRPWWRKLFKL
jgi:hypothetical protein